MATEKADTEFVRDGYGNVTRATITDGNGNARTQTVEYDEYGFLPIAVINGKQQRTELKFDARSPPSHVNRCSKSRNGRIMEATPSRSSS